MIKVFLLISLVIYTTPVSANEPEKPIQVMVFGTFHFDNPGLDAVNPNVPDVLDAEHQQDIKRVTDALEQFQPDKIAVERLPDQANRLDSLYQAYQEGSHELHRSETQQLGMRLAGRLGHDHLYPVDNNHSPEFNELLEYTMEHEPETAAKFQQWQKSAQKKSDSLQQHLSIYENLKRNNTTDYLNSLEEPYILMKGICADDSYIGAETVSRWYDRNFRIFANLIKIAERGDNVILFIGSGHARILRDLVELSPDLELIDPLDYLE